MTMKICVIIPAYKEEKHIGDVVKEVKSLPFIDEVVVIDDGSPDSTYIVAQNSGAHVIRYEENRGKGFALKTGIDWAINNNYDLIITMDADGQHLPSEIERFIDKIKRDNVDIVVGRRKLGDSMPPIRVFTNGITSIVTSMLCGQRIHDSQSGFRLFKREVLEKTDISHFRFQVETEMLVKACRKGFKVGEVPISVIYGDEKSKVNPFIDTVRFIKMTMEFLWV